MTKTQIIIKESADNHYSIGFSLGYRGEVDLSQTKKDASAKEIKCKDIQDTLQKDNRILKEMLNETENMHLVFLDRDFNFVRVNEAYAKTCGYKPEEMIGKNHFALYPGEEVEAIFKRVRDTGVPTEFHDRPFVFPDQPERGVTYWDWTLKPVKNEVGEVEGFVFSLVETTERKKAEEEVENLAKFPSENPCPVMRISKDGVFLYCNDAAKQILKGFKCDVGEAIPERWRTFVDKSFDARKRREYEAQIGKRTFTFTISPVVDYVNVYGHDLTERKKAEDALKRSEWVARQRAEELENLKVKLEEKAVEVQEYANHMENLAKERAQELQDAERLAAIGATAGMVGHDIRNPLQAIVGDLYLIASEVATLPEVEEKKSIEESVASIMQSVDYIDKIVQDLQDYAKPLKPIAQKTNLEQMCQELLLDVNFPENIDAKYLLEEEAEEVVADPAFLKRILSNLVSNAVQAMPEGGKLEIKSRQGNGEVVITVQDSGVGVPPANRDKLFTPLFTTKARGQGFGLAVVKRMTEALGGTVTFESEEGKGTKFAVRLPVAKK